MWRPQKILQSCPQNLNWWHQKTLIVDPVKFDTDKISLTGSLDLTDQNNKIIGELRSACYSPYFKKVIGIAMMKKDHWNTDQNVKAKVNGENCTGKVCDLPFI